MSKSLMSGNVEVIYELVTFQVITTFNRLLFISLAMFPVC